MGPEKMRPEWDDGYNELPLVLRPLGQLDGGGDGCPAADARQEALDSARGRGGGGSMHVTNGKDSSHKWLHRARNIHSPCTSGVVA